MAIGRRVQVDFTSYVAERTSGFVGREWVLEDVRAWLESPSGPRFLLITGAPGSGKTAVAARWVKLSERQAEPDTPAPASDASSLPRGFSTHSISVPQATTVGATRARSRHAEAKEVTGGSIIGTDAGIVRRRA